MGGGLMQLVAYGAQDIYLTGNPQITFFKVVYRRHTNFSMEAIEQTFNGTANFGKKVTCTISRNGDLIHKVYVQVKIPSVTVACGKAFRWLNWLGHCIVSEVSVEIGGQTIDRQYGEWMHIWNELTCPADKKDGVARMLGNVTGLTQWTVGSRVDTGESATVTPEATLYVPLQFFFCRNIGLSLPLIALQYHEVKINLTFGTEAACTATAKVGTSAPAVSVGDVTVGDIKSASLFVDYIYLDTDERRRFAQVSHEYLIEQLQFTGKESLTSGANHHKIKLNFNHPVKELVWTVQSSGIASDDTYAGLTATTLPSNAAYGPPVRKAGKETFNFTDAPAVYPFSGVYVNNLGFAQSSQNSPGMMQQDGLILCKSDDSATVGIDCSQNVCGSDNGLQNDPVDEFSNNFVVGLEVMKDVAGGTGRCGAGSNPVASAKLQLNGHDRFAEREGSYFNYVQPYQHHTNVPATGINVYSFAIKPEEHQPSGSCNLSRIDNATLHLTVTNRMADLKDGIVAVYAVNYNVLRIMSGMGGLAYSN